jgi:hypothetical protein
MEATSCQPAPCPQAGANNPSFTDGDERWGPSITLKAVNHVAIGAFDVEAIRRFYTKVLGFREIPRPAIGFPGAPLLACSETAAARCTDASMRACGLQAGFGAPCMRVGSLVQATGSRALAS